MTLDFTKTADDQTLIQTIRPLLADRMWHDANFGRRGHWWARNHHGTWHKADLYTYWPHLRAVSLELPDTPYWKRSKHRLSTIHSMREITRQLAFDSILNPWPKPADLTLPA